MQNVRKIDYARTPTNPAPAETFPRPKLPRRSLTGERWRQLNDASADVALRSIELMGIRLDRLTEKEAVVKIINAGKRGSGGWVVTPNVDVMRILHRNPELQAKVKEASLMLADGQPLIWASLLQNEPLPERVAGSSLILSLSAAAADAGVRVFLLGGAAGTAATTAALLRRSNPRLKVAGVFCPPLGFDQDARQMAQVHAALAAAKAAIVYVCLGTPKQEDLIHDLRQRFPSTWFLGLGGSFSMISGITRRAPEWMQKTGLEWTWRLAMEPRRMFKRYIIHDIPFGLRLMAHAFRNRKYQLEPATLVHSAAKTQT